MCQAAEGITRRQIWGLSSPPFYSWYHLSFGLPFSNMAGHKVFCDGPASLVSLIIILQLLQWEPRWNLQERPRQTIRWKSMATSVRHATFRSSPTHSSLFHLIVTWNPVTRQAHLCDSHLSIDRHSWNLHYPAKLRYIQHSEVWSCSWVLPVHVPPLAMSDNTCAHCLQQQAHLFSLIPFAPSYNI